MKRLIATLGIAASLFMPLLMPNIAQARSYRTRSSDVYVRGYVRSNGTYVRPYYRTRPDHTKFNNYGCIDYGRCW